MLLLKTCAKQVVFFGFLTVCSTSMVSAMSVEDNKQVEIDTTKVPLHVAAARSDYKNVQRLCKQYTEEKTLDNVINQAATIQCGIQAMRPLEYALVSLIGHINYNYDGTSPVGFHRLAVAWLITMKTLLAHGAILKKDNQNVSQDLLAALTLAVDDEKAIDYNKMGKVLKQIYDSYNSSVLVLTACIEQQLADASKQ